MPTSEASPREFRLTRLIAWLLLVLSPAVYIVVAAFLAIPDQSGGQIDMTFYILLILALFQPALLPLIERLQTANFRRPAPKNTNPRQLAMTMHITKFAFVEAIFIYGLVIFILSGDWARFLIFYPVGIVWAAIYWPRQERWQSLAKRLEVT